MSKYYSHCWGTRAKLVKRETVKTTKKVYYCPKCDKLEVVVEVEE